MSSSVTMLWNTRNAKPGRRRHWVRLDEDMHIWSDDRTQSGVLSLSRNGADGPLRVILNVDGRRISDEITANGELLITIKNVKLLLVVRAVEESRVFLEFGMPRGDQTRIAISA